MGANLEAASSNNRRKALVQLRDSLAAALDSCDANMLPQLAGQYRATLVELDALPAETVVTAPDELRKLREARRANVAGQAVQSRKAK